MLLAVVEALILSVRPIRSVTVPAPLLSTVNIDKPIMSWSWSIHYSLLDHTTLNQRSWHCVKWPRPSWSLFSPTQLVRKIKHSIRPISPASLDRLNCGPYNVNNIYLYGKSWCQILVFLHWTFPHVLCFCFMTLFAQGSELRVDVIYFLLLLHKTTYVCVCL